MAFTFSLSTQYTIFRSLADAATIAFESPFFLSQFEKDAFSTGPHQVE
jgi:hypothetical protein